MTVPAARTLDNYLDTGRKIPSEALVPSVLTDLEGASMERVTGPGSTATIVLAHPATSVVAVLAFITATGAVSLVNPLALEGTNYSVTLENADGVCALTELNSDNRSTETWLVFYHRKSVDPTQGQRGTVTP